MPAVAVRMQGHDQHARCCGVADDTVRPDRPEPVMTLAAGPHDELADARRVSAPGGILRGEALVVVVVPVEHDIGVGGEQIPPERVINWVVAVLAGAESRLMPVREDARRGMLAQVGREPPLFRGAGRTAADEVAFGVQRDEVPPPQVIAVVTPAWVAGGGPEVAVVAAGIAAQVLVITGNRMADRIETPPAGTEIALVALVPADRVLVVTELEHRGGMDPLEKVAGGHLAAGRHLAGRVLGQLRV